jgi:hypothetical protein
MKIGFVYSKEKLSGRLTKFWTNSYCYHVFIYDNENGKMYDQHLLFRRRRWPQYETTHVALVDSPVEISSQFLEDLLDTDENVYGWIDYLLFAFRSLYHFFGQSTPNAKGVICSELVYNILKANGWNRSFLEVPSPADMEKALNAKCPFNEVR